MLQIGAFIIMTSLHAVSEGCDVLITILAAIRTSLYRHITASQNSLGFLYQTVKMKTLLCVIKHVHGRNVNSALS